MKNKYLYLVLLVFIVLISFLFINNKNTNQNKNISNISAEEYISSDIKNKGIVLDVRTKSEYNEGHIAGSVNIDWNNTELFKSEIEKLDKNKTYILYCRTGNRSGQALKYMSSLGFKNVYNILGGVSTGKLPLVKIDNDIQTNLDKALLDEYKARALYEKIISKYGDIRPFSNIIKAEENHIKALENLYEKYNLLRPTFNFENIQAPENVKIACETGVQAEIDNAKLYRENLIPNMKNYSDIVNVFTNLMNASEQNHLKAFERCAR